MCWGEYDCNPDIETTFYGENAMASLLIFIYNCTANDSQMLTKYIIDYEGDGLFYRVHRYNYVSEKYAQEEEEEVTKGLKKISEWYTRIF